MAARTRKVDCEVGTLGPGARTEFRPRAVFKPHDWVEVPYEDGVETHVPSSVADTYAPPPALRGELAERGRRATTAACIELLVPVACASAVAFALIPLGRPAAWVCLFALSAGLGWLVNRAAGTIAAVTAILLYLWVHGRPRFASTITDPWTIRFAFLLGLAGAAAAAVADWRRHQPESREEPKPGC